MTERRRAGLNEMLAVVTGIADAIRADERVAQRMGQAPNERRLRKADVLDDVGDLIATIIPVKRDVAPILRRVAIRSRHDRGADPPTDGGGSEGTEAQE